MDIIIVIGILVIVLLWPYLRSTPDQEKQVYAPSWEPPPRICRYCGRRHQPRPVPPPELFDPHEDLIRQIDKAWAETHPVPPSPVMLPVLQPGESLEPLRTVDGRIVRYVVVRD